MSPLELQEVQTLLVNAHTIMRKALDNGDTDIELVRACEALHTARFHAVRINLRS